MPIKTACLSLFLLFISSVTVSAQYQSALRMENYAGINSVFLNPASSSTYPLRWDLNLASIDLFFDNNIGFISNTSVGDLSKNGDQVKRGWEMENVNGQDLVADFYREIDKDRYLQLSATVNGPAFLFNTNGGQSLGVFYNFRLMAGVPNLPGTANYYYLTSKAVNELIDFRSFNFNFMAWDEIGAHFSQRIPTANGYISAGINVKALRGYEAAHISLNNDTEISYIENSQVQITGLDVRLGYTSENVDIADTQTYNSDPSGRGLGVDLGFNYVVEDDSDTYKLRLGASLNDIGSVKFTENVEVHGLRNAQVVTLDETRYQDFTSIDQVTEQASADILGSLSLSELDEDLSIGLPTTFSLQADYKVIENVFVSGLFINRISFSDTAVKATNFLAIAPRFEHRWGMLSLPVNITEYKRVKMGAALRLGFIILGTDDLGSIIGTKEFRGTDIYVGIKANPFKIGKGSSKGGARKSGKKSDVKCYKF